MSQPFSPETRPCPECGGQREAIQDIGPEIVAYSTEAARFWNARQKIADYLLGRCTQCGYMAFFQKVTPKHK
ncbi:MAG TPA: hypothetical protein VKT82_34860 [Ktedonobacterales bacterium]|nr:hypothetical protein [Ktedonobacterales bacterium]